jgi:hypothetical protein
VNQDLGLLLRDSFRCYLECSRPIGNKGSPKDLSNLGMKILNSFMLWPLKDTGKIALAKFLVLMEE